MGINKAKIINVGLKLSANMVLLFLCTKFLRLQIDWIYISAIFAVVAFWFCARSINVITLKVDTKDMKVLSYQIEDALSMMLLALLVFHGCILFMFIGFVRSPDTHFIIRSICILTVLELIPLFGSCIFMFLRWKTNIKPVYMKVGNWISVASLSLLAHWIMKVFDMVWSSDIIIKITKDYSPSILCRFCVISTVMFAVLAITNITKKEYQEIYDTQKKFFDTNNENKAKEEKAKKEAISEKTSKSSSTESPAKEKTDEKETKKDN